MKTKCLIALLLLVVLRVAAAEPDNSRVPAADQLWQRIGELQKEPLPQVERVGNTIIYSREYFVAREKHGAVLGDKLMEFIKQYPADPRYAAAVVSLAKLARPVFKEIGDVRTKGWRATIRDEVAESAWNAQVNDLVARLIETPGVTEPTLEAAYLSWVQAARAEAGDNEVVGSVEAVGEFRRRIDVFRAKYPQPKMVGIRTLESQYLNRLRKTKPAAVDEYLANLLHDPVPNIAVWAAATQVTEKLRREPMELVFTAADGRPVDIAKLRGKVVLVDFWATWCGPCVAELPNMLANYRKFHEQGFEVVGITLENAGLTGKEDDVTKVQKLATARQKMLEFTAVSELPWPQYFDGKFWKNDISTKYGILAIPAMFLLDQEGKLVTTDARGPKLETELKRLLKP